MTLAPVVLEGRLVRLEPLNEWHMPDLLHAAADESLWRYMFYGNLAEPALMVQIYPLQSSISVQAKR